jgi:RimJ/RimL family protein N-acetyltransferase
MDANPLQPTLTDEELTLRALRESDWDALFRVASDPLIWSVHPASDRWQEPVFRRFFDDALASGGALLITRSATGEVLGSSRFDQTRAEEGELEIGWTFLARSEWGGATNARVKRLMINHALKHYERVIFLIGETNGRSRRAMEKIGGQLTDRVHQADLGNKSAVHVIYAIDRQAFMSGPLNP